MSDYFKGLGAVLITLAVVVALSIGGWFGYWALHRSSVNRESKITQESYGRQVALHDEVLGDIVTIRTEDAQLAVVTLPADQAAAITAQRKATVDSMCSAASNLTGTVPLDASSEAFVTKECK